MVYMCNVQCIIIYVYTIACACILQLYHSTCMFSKIKKIMQDKLCKYYLYTCKETLFGEAPFASKTFSELESKIRDPNPVVVSIHTEYMYIHYTVIIP